MVSTAMERAGRRLRRQARSIARARHMGVVAGFSAPMTAVVVDSVIGYAAAAFLAFSAFMLLAFSDPR